MLHRPTEQMKFNLKKNLELLRQRYFFGALSTQSMHSFNPVMPNCTVQKMPDVNKKSANKNSYMQISI